MAHNNTVFVQLLKLTPKHEFETLAGRASLRDIISNLSAQVSKLYHLSSAQVSRSSLARVNQTQPHTLYKARWQIGLFFKCIKQNRKIKSFVGTSRNAVMTQIWIAMCLSLLLARIKFCNRIHSSVRQMIRLLQFGNTMKNTMLRNFLEKVALSTDCQWFDQNPQLPLQRR